LSCKIAILASQASPLFERRQSAMRKRDCSAKFVLRLTDCRAAPPSGLAPGEAGADDGLTQGMGNPTLRWHMATFYRENGTTLPTGR